MKLLERHAQLRDLHAALERARQGRGTTVLISGEAGIGKTWVLHAFAAQVAETARVFLGSCEDLLTPRPLGPFRDMARDCGRRAPRDRRRRPRGPSMRSTGSARRPST